MKAASSFGEIRTYLLALEWALYERHRAEIKCEAFHNAVTYLTTIRLNIPLKNGSVHSIDIFTDEDIDVGKFYRTTLTDEVHATIMLLLG